MFRVTPILAALLLVACNDAEQDNVDPESSTGTAGTMPFAQEFVPEPMVPVQYELSPVVNGRISDGLDPTLALTVSANGYTYLMVRNGDGIRYLTDAYVHPVGNYCLGGGIEPDCAGGISWTSGRINTSGHPNSAWCVDEAGGRLFLIKAGVTEAVEVDVSFEGDSAYSFNHGTTLYTPAFPDVGDAVFDGPCAYLPGTGELLFTAPESGWLYTLDLEAHLATKGTQIPDLMPSKVFPLPSSDLVMDDTQTGSILLLSGEDLTVIDSLIMDGGILDFAVDAERGFVWVAQGEAGASRITLGNGPLEATPLPIEGDIRQVVVDPTTGTSLFARLEDEDQQDWSAVLMNGLEEADTETLPAPLLLLTPPGTMGDFTIWLENDSEDDSADFVVYDAVPDRAPNLPPLLIYMISSVEQPLVPGLACEGEIENSVAGIQQIIRMNAEVLDDLDIPITVGLVYNYAQASTECGMTDMPGVLQDTYGFELGHMVHNDPCFNCTDKTVDGTTPELCLAADANYCDPDWVDWECCFPDHEDYCAPADWDCYKTFVDEHNVVVDGFIPGGAAFATGADRHEMWDWDWVRGYQEMERADGTFDGYDVTFMGHSWAYGGVIDSNDPRSKHPAPWRTADAVQAWTPDDHNSWTEDCESSDLLYLPGLPTSTVKLAEWHNSGLFMVDYLSLGQTPTYSESDFMVLHQLLRRSINYRQPTGPNVWYFHVHDLGRYSLTEPDGTELESAAGPLKAFVAMVKDVYVAGGYVEFVGPTDIRSEYPPE